MERRKPSKSTKKFRRNSNRISHSSFINTYRPKTHKTPTTQQKKWVKVQRTKKYSVQQILSVKLHPSSTSTSLINPQLLLRTVSSASSRWRAISNWSQKVRATSDQSTRLFKSLLNKLAQSNIQTIKQKILQNLSQSTNSAFGKILLEKAIIQSKFSQIYANLCKDIMDIHLDFKKQFLTACQVSFEKLVFDEPDRKKLFTAINFFGELFNCRAIPQKILCNCCQVMLLDKSEMAVQGLCHLLGTCNWVFNNKNLKQKAQGYLKQLEKMKDQMPSRIKFKVMDLLESKNLKVLHINKRQMGCGNIACFKREKETYNCCLENIGIKQKFRGNPDQICNICEKYPPIDPRPQIQTNLKYFQIFPDGSLSSSHPSQEFYILPQFYPTPSNISMPQPSISNTRVRFKS